MLVKTSETSGSRKPKGIGRRRDSAIPCVQLEMSIPFGIELSAGGKLSASVLMLKNHGQVNLTDLGQERHAQGPSTEINYSFRYFLTSDIAQFDTYVPKSKYRLLDREIMSFLIRNPKLHELGFKLSGLEKVRVGDVVQMTEAEIREQTSASDKVIAELKEFLKPYGLQLGMKAPDWKSKPVKWRG